jgi:hypothetical protein
VQLNNIIYRVALDKDTDLSIDALSKNVYIFRSYCTKHKKVNISCVVRREYTLTCSVHLMFSSLDKFAVKDILALRCLFERLGFRVIKFSRTINGKVREITL